MITLCYVKRLVRIVALDMANLHDYRNTGIIEDLWSELRMPESLSLVSRK